MFFFLWEVEQPEAGLRALGCGGVSRSFARSRKYWTGFAEVVVKPRNAGTANPIRTGAPTEH